MTFYNTQVGVPFPYYNLDTNRHIKMAAISLSVFFVAGMAIVLVIICYQIMSIMKKDIQNRSVYYCDSEPAGDRSYDLIVRDPERQFKTTATLLSSIE